MSYPDFLKDAMDEALASQTNSGETMENETTEVANEVSTVFTKPEQPVKDLSIKGLDEKAVLVQVKRRMYAPYKLDKDESDSYGAGNVNKHLFEGRQNKVKDTISKFTEVYTFVKKNTVPWSTGVEMLNIEHYMEFSSGLRSRIDEANQAVEDLYVNWDTEVQKDLDRLKQIAMSKGKPNLANPLDYPDKDEMRARFGIEVRYLPVPTTGDFRVEISDDDKESLKKHLSDAERNATTHVLEQMMEPLKKAIDKLSIPIGEDGAIFRDTLIDNLVDVSDRMLKVNISDDETVIKQIKDLQSVITVYSGNKDALRESDGVRRGAVNKLSDLVNQMSGLV